MKIPHISVSRRGVWGTCQQQYKYQYHLGVQVDEPEPFYFTYGKLVHKIAEEYVNAGGKCLLEEISRDVINGRIPIDHIPGENGDPGTDVFAPSLPPEYKKRLPGNLKAIAKITKKLGYAGKTEYQFRYDLDPPHERYVTGLIDRLIENGDQWIILDYKTTKRGPWRKTPNTITSDLQLRCYAKVVQKDFGVPAKNIRAALYYLDGANLVGAQFSQAAIDDAEAELLRVYKEVENCDPNDVWGNVGDHCRRCKFVKMCPFYRLT